MPVECNFSDKKRTKNLKKGFRELENKDIDRFERNGKVVVLGRSYPV